MSKEESMKIDQAIEDRKDKLGIYKTLVDILFNEEDCKIMLNFAKHKEVHNLLELLRDE